MDVLAGSYDGLVVAYRLDADQTPSAPLKLTQKFNDVSHNGCVKVMAVSEKGIVASGSTDESVHLFDLLRSSDIGSLVSHEGKLRVYLSEGDVNAVRFMGKDFLYTASADGTIKMWRARIWELQRTLKGHKGAVLGFDIHPSRKLALSVGGDKKLIAWDLVAGKYSFIRNIKKIYDALVFSPSGSRFLLRAGSTVEAYDLTQTDAIYSEDLESHVNDCAFLSDDLFVTADDTGKVKVWNIPEKTFKFDFQAHESRTRCVVPARSTDENRLVVATCSSQDEMIKAWIVNVTDKKVTLLTSVTTGCRLTCLSVHSTPAVVDQLLDRAPAGDLATYSVDSGKDSRIINTVKIVVPHNLETSSKELIAKKLKKNLPFNSGSKRKKLNEMKKKRRNNSDNVGKKKK